MIIFFCRVISCPTTRVQCNFRQWSSVGHADRHRDGYWRRVGGSRRRPVPGRDLRRWGGGTYAAASTRPSSSSRVSWHESTRSTTCRRICENTATLRALNSRHLFCHRPLMTGGVLNSNCILQLWGSAWETESEPVLCEACERRVRIQVHDPGRDLRRPRRARQGPWASAPLMHDFLRFVSVVRVQNTNSISPLLSMHDNAKDLFFPSIVRWNDFFLAKTCLQHLLYVLNYYLLGPLFSMHHFTSQFLSSMTLNCYLSDT